MTLKNRSFKHLLRVSILFGTLYTFLLLSNDVSAQDTIRQVQATTINTASPAIPKATNFKKHKTIQKTETPTDIKQASDNEIDTSISVMKQHSPRRALIYSAVLPGLGQVYNKQAWKIPIIYVGAGVVTYFAVTNYQGKVKFETEYRNRMNGNTEALLPNYANYPDNNIYNIYQSYNRNFQLSLICGGLVYALNLIDAYVYGHLFDFEINDDISMRIAPKVDILPYNNDFIATGVALQIRF